jgi:hypothetical protein
MRGVKILVREGREGHEENQKNFIVEPPACSLMRFVSVTPIFAFLRVSSRPSRTKKVFK